jgi:hypothetical protein
MSQKNLFFVIVGSALVLVAFLAALSPFLPRWLGPPDLPATVTVMAIRATNVSLTATEAAVEGRTIEISSHQVSEESLAGTNDLTWEGLQIEILAIDDNAWPLIKFHNHNNEPPLAGKQMLLIKLRISKPGGTEEEYIGIDSSDFKLIGSHNVVYTPWGDESRCGVVPDELDGVVTEALSVEGNVCFQVPRDDNRFKLVYEQYIGDYPAIYIDLPE